MSSRRVRPWLVGLVLLAPAWLPAGTPTQTAAPAAARIEGLRWSTQHLDYSGYFVAGTGPTLRPGTASGVRMVYQVALRGQQKVLATVSGPATVRPLSDTRAEVYPPQLPDNLARWLAQQFSEITPSLHFTLLPNGTFSLVQACMGFIRSLPAGGRVSGPMARLLRAAAVKAAPEAAHEHAADMRAITEMQRAQHEANMNIINNIKNCEPGKYCP